MIYGLMILNSYLVLRFYVTLIIDFFECQFNYQI
jgi:hypothetical protein